MSTKVEVKYQNLFEYRHFTLAHIPIVNYLLLIKTVTTVDLSIISTVFLP